MTTLNIARSLAHWLLQPQDPVARELAALERDRATGIARKLARLNRALREADEQDIQHYHQAIADYLTVVGGSTSVVEEIEKMNVIMPNGDPPKTTSQRLLPAPQKDGEVETEVRPTVEPVYWVSTAILAEAYAHLTQHLPDTHQEPEWMLAVSGLRKDNKRYTLEQLIEVELSLQTPGNASFNMQDFARIAITLSRHGQALHAIFHSHRLRGPQNPSATDWRLQETLDQAGYPAIQAVFSEDGYVRFFAHKPFTVEIYGKGVEQIHADNHLYRITNFGTLPQPRRIS